MMMPSDDYIAGLEAGRDESGQAIAELRADLGAWRPVVDASLAMLERADREGGWTVTDEWVEAVTRLRGNA